MKSDDYPGKPKLMRGMRAPTPIAGETVGDKSHRNSRAAMLAASVESSSVAPETMVSLSPVILESEWAAAGTLCNVQINLIIRSPYQPRLVFDQAGLEELATSIQSVGQIKPILVRPLPDGTFELVGGERRWLAHQLFGADTIQAIVKPMPDMLARILALTDNEQEDLTDYERGRAYMRVLDSGEESSIRGLARSLGINHSIVSRCLQLMSLPESVRLLLDEKPRLITANYAKKFVDYSAGHGEIVLSAVKAMAEEGIQQEAAIRLIDAKIAAASFVPQSKQAARSIVGLGTMKVAGRKVEFQCAKGIDPQRLSDQFEEFLKTVDMASLSIE